MGLVEGSGLEALERVDDGGGPGGGGLEWDTDFGKTTVSEDGAEGTLFPFCFLGEPFFRFDFLVKPPAVALASNPPIPPPPPMPYRFFVGVAVESTDFVFVPFILEERDCVN